MDKHKQVLKMQFACVGCLYLAAVFYAISYLPKIIWFSVGVMAGISIFVLGIISDYLKKR